MEEKIIHYNSPEAAQFKTGISGWVSADGRFFGKDEALARYAGCTHKKCEACDNYANKGWIYCESCRGKRAVERWAALPFEKWDGKKPICLFDGYKYFFNEDELIEYLDENELNGSDIMLVICEPISYPQLDTDYFSNDAHDDWEPEAALVEAIRKLNEVVVTLKPHSYKPGKIRTLYSH